MRAGPSHWHVSGDSVRQGHACSRHELAVTWIQGTWTCKYNRFHNFCGAKLENETRNASHLKQFEEFYEIQETAIEINSCIPSLIILLINLYQPVMLFIMK
jgi:hypothetical protein